MLQAVADAAATRDYALTVVTLGARTDVPAAFERLAEQGVDGTIVLNEATAAVRDAPISAGSRTVVVDSPPDDRFAIVQTDHAAGARVAVDHLLGLGHETVHHVAGPADSYASSVRERGWRAALRDAGRTQPEVVRGDWAAASGARAAGELAARGATAVFCANDQMALGLLGGLADLGLEVPADVSVVGFDDVADAAQYRPPLTTVRQDFDALAQRAVARLVLAIESGGAGALAGGAELVEARLVPRRSTAPAA
jgi:DNA-binding LacI/PurR family transcriptional regulator